MKGTAYVTCSNLSLQRAMENSNIFGQWLYYPYILGVFIAYSMGLTSDKLLYRILFLFGLACLAVKVLLIDEYTTRELILIFVIAGLVILNFLHNGDKTYLLGFIAVAGAKGIDYKKIFKAAFYLRLVLMILTMLHASIFGSEITVTNSSKTYSQYIDATADSVESLGFIHPNTAYIAAFSVAALCTLVYWEKLRIWHYLLLTAGMGLLFRILVCRAGFLCWIALLMIIGIYRILRNRISRIWYLRLLCLIPMAMCVLVIWLSVYATTPDNLPLRLGRYIQGTFFARFAVAHPDIPNLIREPLGASVWDWKDIAYIHMLHNNGWILGLIFLSAYIRTMWVFAKEDRAAETIIMAAWAIYMVAEYPAISTGYNLSLLFITDRLYRNYKGVIKVKTVSVKTLFGEVRKHFIPVILAMVVCALVFGAFGYKGISKKISSTDQSTVATWETGVKNTENTIASLEEQLSVAENELQSQKEYAENSIYMRLNSQAFYSANIQIALKGEGDIGGALNSYHMFVTEGDFRNKLAEKAGIEDESRLKEVISGYIYSNMYIVNILYDTENGADTLKSAAEKVLVDQAESIASIRGSFVVQVISSSVQNRAESGILDTQNSKLNSLRSYENTVKDLTNQIENQKTNLINLKTEGSGVSTGGIAGGKKWALIFSLVGAMAAFVISLIVLAYKAISDGTIRGVQDIRGLGLTPINEDDNIDYTIESIKLQAVKENVSHLVLAVMKKQQDELTEEQTRYIERLSKECGGMDIRVIDAPFDSIKSLDILVRCEAVILSILPGKSMAIQVDKIAELCSRFRIPIWGAIMVNGIK